MRSGTRDVFRLWETVQDRDIVALKDYRKLYMTYRMASLRVTLYDLEGHLCCL